MHHDLKIEPPYFEAVLNGIKPFEIRYNDRGIQKGDTVSLQEYTGGYAGRFTGRRVLCEITYVTAFAQKDGWVVFGIKQTAKQSNTAVSRPQQKD